MFGLYIMSITHTPTHITLVNKQEWNTNIGKKSYKVIIITTEKNNYPEILKNNNNNDDVYRVFFSLNGK